MLPSGDCLPVASVELMQVARKRNDNVYTFSYNEDHTWRMQ